MIRTARRIAIKPGRSASLAPRLVYFLPAIPPCIARIIGNPLLVVRLILALGAGGLIRYNPASRIGILAGRNLHICAITKATSSACRASLPPPGPLSRAIPPIIPLSSSPFHVPRELDPLASVPSLPSLRLSPTRYLLLCKAARSA